MTEATTTTATNTAPAMREARTLVLPKSKMTVVFDADFSTSDVINAQKASGKETGLFVLYLAQSVALFDGKKLTMGEIKEKVRGKDYLKLAGEMLGDEDAAGN